MSCETPACSEKQVQDAMRPRQTAPDVTARSGPSASISRCPHAGATGAGRCGAHPAGRQPGAHRPRGHQAQLRRRRRTHERRVQAQLPRRQQRELGAQHRLGPGHVVGAAVRRRRTSSRITSAAFATAVGVPIWSLGARNSRPSLSGAPELVDEVLPAPLVAVQAGHPRDHEVAAGDRRQQALHLLLLAPVLVQRAASARPRRRGPRGRRTRTPTTGRRRSRRSPAAARARASVPSTLISLLHSGSVSQRSTFETAAAQTTVARRDALRAARATRPRRGCPGWPARRPRGGTGADAWDRTSAKLRYR